MIMYDYYTMKIIFMTNESYDFCNLWLMNFMKNVIFEFCNYDKSIMTFVTVPSRFPAIVNFFLPC